MPTISLTRVANSPAFAQSFTVNRSTGTFQQGGFVSTTSPLDFWGIIQPATDEDVAQVPEGDRSTGMMGFISEQRMYKTYVEGSTSGIGDTITWNGQTYRLVTVGPWKDFGFWKAIGARLSGE
jgi:hypothetical protein